MTIDDLWERKSELLARKKYELDLQARGKGDPLALFMVNEELLEVYAHIRLLKPLARLYRRPGNMRSSENVKRRSMEKTVFSEWSRCDSDADGSDSAEKTKEVLQTAVANGIDSMTVRQREVFSLWSEGHQVSEIAKELNLSISSVLRTLERAKIHVTRTADVRMAVEYDPEQGALTRGLDIPKALSNVLTLSQMICLYLRYARGYSPKKVSTIRQVAPSTVSRTLSRALSAISSELGADPTAAGNEEKMDAVLLAIYRTLCTRIAEIPEPVRAYIKEQPSPGYVRTVSRGSRAKDQGGKMNIIKIAPHANGGHNNQSWCGPNIPVPNGWAIVPDNLETENFPFGEVTVEEVNGVPTVTSWTPLPMPDPAPEPEPETEPTVWDELDEAYTEGVNAAYDQ